MRIELHRYNSRKWRIFTSPAGFERTIYIDLWHFQLVIELDRGYGDD